MHTNATKYTDEKLEIENWTPCEVSGHSFHEGFCLDCGETMTYEQLSDEEKADLNNSLMAHGLR